MAILNKEVVSNHVRLLRLADVFNRAYRGGEALVSDDVYDSITQRINQLEKLYPALTDGETHIFNNKVGISPYLDMPSVKHPVPMLSLNNIFQREQGDQYIELREWIEKTNKLLGRMPYYAVNYKFDGLALEVNVVDSEIVMLSTRGDGITGNDVSHMSWLIRFPELKPYLETDNVYIRGEVVVMKEDLEKVNVKRHELAMRPYRNTRNTAAGLLRAALGSVVELKKQYELELIPDLYFIPHGGVCYTSDGRYKQLSALMGDMHNHPESISDDPDTLVELVSAVLARRNTEKFDLDGAVISVFDPVARDHIESLQPSRGAPNWAIAFKFLAEEAVTTLLDIIWQVARSGELTPVAIIEPVPLCGVVVSRATLHNPAYIQQEGLQIGKLVGVKRSGDVIPVVFGIEESDSAPAVAAVPCECPACGADITHDPEENKPRCIQGTQCPGARLASLVHVFGKKVLNVKGLGEAKLRELLDAIPSLTVWGVYELPPEMLGAVHKTLHADKRIKLATFIRALDLPTIGNTASNLIANNVRTVEGLLVLCEVDSCVWLTDRLLDIIKAHKDDIAYGIGHARRVGFSIEPMRELNIHPNITDKTFCVTGSFTNYSRDQIKEIIQQHGGRVSSKVNANTAYLIAGNKPTASKINDAKRFDIPVYYDSLFDLSAFDVLK